jgi:ribosomal protein S18 acetylase RimI-like enzyme
MAGTGSTPPPIVIREAARDDWPAIERLVSAAWHDDYCTSAEIYQDIERLEEKLDWLKDEFDSFGSRFFVAEDQGRLTGLVVGHAHGGRVWIDDLFVHPDARRQGVARALLERSTPRDAEVRCEVNARNAAGIALFREMGFEKIVETVVLRRPPQG